MILQKIKADAEAYLGDKVTQAVITGPRLFWRFNKRQATKQPERCRAWSNENYQWTEPRIFGLRIG